MEILLQNKDSTIAKSDLTSMDGKFMITAEKGEYLLLVKELGLILYKQKINAIQNLELNIIHINESQHLLKEVVVTSKKK